MFATLAECCDELYAKMEAMSASEGAVRASLQQKYSALNIEIGSVVLLLPHFVMALAAIARKGGEESEAERERNGVRVVQCLVSVPRNVSAVRAETGENDATTLSEQVHGVVVPPLVALVVREQN